jgi:hypothetical protein
MKLEKTKLRLKVKMMTSQPSTDEEPGPNATNPADKTEEATTPDEEATKLDQEDEEEIPAPEATATGTANTVTSARSRDINKKNAGSESRRINPAETTKDDTIGQRFTSWRRTTPNPSTPLITKRSELYRTHLTLPDSILAHKPVTQELQPSPRYSRVFSKELDDSPHPSVIPQIILSLCTVSIATCNKLFENMALFNGDHKETKITGTVNGKNFYWKIDTGPAVTCMNINAFKTAFGKTKEKNQKDFKNSGYT